MPQTKLKNKTKTRKARRQKAVNKNNRQSPEEVLFYPVKRIRSDSKLRKSKKAKVLVSLSSDSDSLTGFYQRNSRFTSPLPPAEFDLKTYLKKQGYRLILNPYSAVFVFLFIIVLIQSTFPVFSFQGNTKTWQTVQDWQEWDLSNLEITEAGNLVLAPYSEEQLTQEEEDLPEVVSQPENQTTPEIEVISESEEDTSEISEEPSEQEGQDQEEPQVLGVDNIEEETIGQEATDEEQTEDQTTPGGESTQSPPDQEEAQPLGNEDQEPVTEAHDITPELTEPELEKNTEDTDSTNIDAENITDNNTDNNTEENTEENNEDEISPEAEEEIETSEEATRDSEPEEDSNMPLEEPDLNSDSAPAEIIPSQEDQPTEPDFTIALTTTTPEIVVDAPPTPLPTPQYQTSGFAKLLFTPEPGQNQVWVDYKVKTEEPDQQYTIEATFSNNDEFYTDDLSQLEPSESLYIKILFQGTGQDTPILKSFKLSYQSQNQAQQEQQENLQGQVDQIDLEGLSPEEQEEIKFKQKELKPLTLSQKKKQELKNKNKDKKVAENEVTEGRGQFYRQFQITEDEEEGLTTYQVEIFREPVNFLDEDGTWQPVDNTIEEITDQDIEIETTEEESTASLANAQDDAVNFAYATLQNVFKTYFPEIANQPHRIEFNNRIVEYRIDNANPNSQAQVQGNQITYEEVFDQVDFVYTINNSQVKEDIIIKAPTNLTEISYQMKIKNVTFFKEENGNINFYDKDTSELVWTLQKPFAQDYIGQTAQGELQITPLDDDTYQINLIEPYESLHDPRVVFPVIIDPTVTIYVGGDTYIDGRVLYDGSTYTDDNTTTDNAIGGIYNTDIYRAYYDFDTTGIDDNATITDVELHINVASVVGTPTHNIRPMTAKASGRTAQQIYDDAGDGTAYVSATTTFQSTGDKTVDLCDDAEDCTVSGKADKDLENLLSSDYFSIGIQGVETSDKHYSTFRTEEGSNDAYLTITYNFPSPCGDLTIGTDVTLDQNLDCTSITINNGATVTTAGYTLTADTFTINNGTVAGGANNVIINATTTSLTTSSITSTNNITFNVATTTLAGTITATNGDVTINADGDIILSGAAVKAGDEFLFDNSIRKLTVQSSTNVWADKFRATSTDFALNSSNLSGTTTLSIVADSLTLNTGVITHQSNGEQATTTLTITNDITLSNSSSITSNLDITAANLTLESGNTLSASARGYSANAGPGAGGNLGGGAGYGGVGGDGGDGGGGGSSYGTSETPLHLGSGGDSEASAGGKGGGLINISLTGTLTNSGTISSNGNNGVNTAADLQRSGGGGSGGTINISTVTFDGSGTLTANGGAGGDAAASCANLCTGGGGGGGGRIYISYTTKNFTGTYTTNGGAGGTGGTGNGVAGEDGTIGIYDSTNDDLDIEDGWHWQTGGDTGFRDVTIINAKNVETQANFTLTLTGDLTVSTSTWTLNSGTYTSITADDLRINNSTITHSGNGEKTTTTLSITNDIEISSSSSITSNLDITATNLTLESGNTLSANGKGYNKDTGPGVGTFGGGAGYGGAGGGTDDGGEGGSTYGSNTAPIHLGSGGDSEGSAGGKGGGMIYLNITNNFVHNGSVTANGNNGVNTAADLQRSGGGGSGGTVYVSVGNTFSGNGTLTADGGDGGDALASCDNLCTGGGGGGGGRIATWECTDSYSGTPTVNGGAGGTGGTGNGLAGSSGTTYNDATYCLPTGSFNSASQKTDGTGTVDISIEVDDPGDNDTKAKIEYVSGGACDFSSPGDPTLAGPATADFNDSGGAPDVDNAQTYQVGSGTNTRIITSSGSNTVQFDWSSATDQASADGTYCLRLTVNNDTNDQTTSATTTLTLDNVDPTGLADFAAPSASGADVTLTWTAASDTNFNHYEIWWGANQSDVQNRQGTATEYDNDDDANLATASTATATITANGSGTDYFKIWAVDDYGNEQTVSDVSYVYNAAPTGSFNSVSAKTDGTGYVDISIEVDDADDDDTKAKIEYTSDSSCSSGWTAATLVGPATADYNDSGGAPDIDNAQTYQVGSGTNTRIITSSGSNTVTFDWDSKTDAASGDGTYCLRLTVNDDTVDQSTPATQTVTIDNVNPTVSSLTISDPASADYNDGADDWYDQGDHAQMAFTSTPSDTNLSSCDWTWDHSDGTSYDYSDTNVEIGTDGDISTADMSGAGIDLSNDGDGTVTLTVTCTDTYGNSGNTNISFKFDNTAPTEPGSIQCDSGASWSQDTDIVITWNGSTDTGGSGVSGYTADYNVNPPTTSHTSGDTLTGAESASATFYVRASDNVGNTSTVGSCTIGIDLTDPSGLANFAAAVSDRTTAALSWDVTTETNFNHYEIWYGTTLTDVQSRGGTATEYDNDDDSNLATITTSSATISSLTAGQTYYFKIWAVDDSGREETTTYSSITMSVCGDGQVDGSEQCDGSDLDGQTCEGLGYESGVLACSADCTFDTSDCNSGDGGGGGDSGDLDLTITNVQATDIQGTSADIAWNTNLLADSLVTYGLTTNYELDSVYNGTYTKSHSVTLTSLNYNTTYYYKVKSVTETFDSNEVSGFSFTTAICNDGETRQCGTTDVGVCQYGTETCTDGAWGTCTDAIYPTDEDCTDGLDNDCDGLTDSDDADCQCTPGDTQLCDTGLLGQCSSGQQTCQADGLWGECQSINEPTDEDCTDGLDNDCDGLTDSDDADCQCTPGDTKQCGTTDVGVCEYGTETCQDNGTWGACDAIEPTTELCGDNLDNDCDGLTDEGCLTCTPGDTQVCGVTDEGICEYGTRTCQEDGTWGECQDAVYSSPEICNDGLDNDCDGFTDEGCEACTPGEERTCGATNVGACEYGYQICQDNGLWGICSDAVYPTEEVCGDGLDNDCNGEIDENCCQPYWECSDWSDCVDGQQFRICIDLNSCGITEGQPETSRSCEECQPDWQCDWSTECIDGFYDYVCIDLNECDQPGEPPYELPQPCSEECIIDCPTCFTPDLEECTCIQQAGCCGNGLCEEGESYNTCSADCGSPLAQCQDGIDNDNDGTIDYPEDSGCESPQDNDESNLTEVVISIGETAQNLVEYTQEISVKTIQTIQENVIQPVAQVIDNPEVEEVAEKAVAPTLVAVGGATAFSALNLTNLIAYLQYIITQPFYLLTRRRRKKWGTVYNAVTKQPVDLAIVRLYDRTTNRLVRSRVTDKAGRYNFLVPPGYYYLTITKPEYTFPSQILRDKKSDVKYLDIYHGEVIDVVDKDVLITANIPLDPQKAVETPQEIIRKRRFRKIQKGLAFASVPLSFIPVLIIPSTTTVSLFGIQTLLFLLFRKLAIPAKPKGWGIVYDKASKQPVKNTIMRIFDKQYNKLLETQVTDAKGRYSFLTSGENYYIVAEKEGYQRFQTDIPAKLEAKEKEKEKAKVVTLDIGLEKEEKKA